MTRSVARADVAELTAALESMVVEEGDHHLVIVSTNKVISSTQFKQMFYSRGDDFFQIANCYACPDSASSIHNSVWGIVNSDLTTMGENRLSNGEVCYNFNKLGGRHNDPSGVAWAYSYVHDQSRNFYAQHEVMGYLEQDTCVKKHNWTLCSRMSIQDQLYGLAFASETDQDLCMKVTCARRWSEVEDALAESCLANQPGYNGIGKGTPSFDASHVDLYINVRITNAHPETLDTILRIRFTVIFDEHNPSELNSWNTRASKAGSGVIQSGVAGDAPEGGEGSGAAPSAAAASSSVEEFYKSVWVTLLEPDDEAFYAFFEDDEMLLFDGGMVRTKSEMRAEVAQRGAVGFFDAIHMMDEDDGGAPRIFNKDYTMANLESDFEIFVDRSFSFHRPDEPEADNYYVYMKWKWNDGEAEDSYVDSPITTHTPWSDSNIWTVDLTVMKISKVNGNWKLICIFGE